DRGCCRNRLWGWLSGFGRGQGIGLFQLVFDSLDEIDGAFFIRRVIQLGGISKFVSDFGSVPRFAKLTQVEQISRSLQQGFNADSDVMIGKLARWLLGSFGIIVESCFQTFDLRIRRL